MRRNPHFKGHQKAVSLATGQQLSVSDCKWCGHAIAWATSKRTGKRYPCNVFPKKSLEYGSDPEHLRAAPWVPHQCAREEAA